MISNKNDKETMAFTTKANKYSSVINKCMKLRSNKNTKDKYTKGVLKS